MFATIPVRMLLARKEILRGFDTEGLDDSLDESFLFQSFLHLTIDRDR